MITEEMRQVWYGSDLSFDVDEADKKIQRIIELHEANYTNPEPVGYIYKHRLEQMLNSEVDNDCNFFPIKDDVSRVIFNRKRDKYLALYSELPTKEPLSDDDIWRIWDEGDNVSSALDFARAIEQAHGIGVK